MDTQISKVGSVIAHVGLHLGWPWLVSFKNVLNVEMHEEDTRNNLHHVEGIVM